MRLSISPSFTTPFLKGRRRDAEEEEEEESPSSQLTEMNRGRKGRGKVLQITPSPNRPNWPQTWYVLVCVEEEGKRWYCWSSSKGEGEDDIMGILWQKAGSNKAYQVWHCDYLCALCTRIGTVIHFLQCFFLCFLLPFSPLAMQILLLYLFFPYTMHGDDIWKVKGRCTARHTQRDRTFIRPRGREEQGDRQ